MYKISMKSCLGRLAVSLVMTFAVFALSACTRTAVDTTHDPNASFKNLKTYSWAQIQFPEDRLQSYPDVRDMVKKSVDLVLRLKGFELRESGPVDFKVATYAGVKSAMMLEKSGRVDDPSWLGATATYDYTKTGKVTLFIDIFDGKTGQLMWRGNGIGFIREYSRGKKMQQNINTRVAEILRSFPPR